MEFEYSAVGFLAGLLMGLTGMGGGAVVTPVLLSLGFNPATAVGTDLAFGALTKAAGAAQHWRAGTVHRGVVLGLAAGSVPGSLAALLALQLLRHHDAAAADRLMERGVGLILVVVALVTILHLRRPSAAATTTEHRPGRPPRAAALAPVGFAVGFTVGLTSIGSGTLLMSFLLLAWPASALTLVGTDLAHGVLLTAVAAAGHASMGDTDPWLLLSLLAGSLPGIVAGTRLARRLPNRLLKGTFAALLLAAGLRLV